MSFASFPHVTPRLRRSVLPQPIVLAALLALGACDGSEHPLAPTGEASAPADEETVVAADQAATHELALATTAQRILFTSIRKGTYDLFKMDPQGNSVVRLTSFMDYEVEPAWSYDNKSIALVRPRPDPSSLKYLDIYLMNADGSNKRWARSLPSSFNIASPSWSPDGSRLVVTVTLGGVSYLATMDVATGQMAFVMLAGKPLQGRYPSYDKTGTKIFYLGATAKTVEMVDPAGNQAWWVFSATTAMSRPRVSPDGTKIAYEKRVGTNTDIYVQALWNGTPKRLTTHSGVDAAPTWSPDGSKLAFASTRSGKYQIWTMNAATGGSLTRITHTTVNETDPAWSH
jgi:Tol biopolymer transport system component